jgi:hypothetical protein
MLFWFKSPNALKQALTQDHGASSNQKIEKLRKENTAIITEMISQNQNEISL